MSNGPLSTLLSTTSAKTAIPMIKDGAYATLRLVKLTQENIPDKGETFKWEFDLVAPVDSTDHGVQILPGALGAKQFHTMRMYGKDGRDAAVGRTMTEVGKFIDALLGTGDVGNTKGKPERPELFDQGAAAQGVAQLDPETVNRLIGQELLAQMKVRTGDYTGNEIGKVFFPADKRV